MGNLERSMGTNRLESERLEIDFSTDKQAIRGFNRAGSDLIMLSDYMNGKKQILGHTILLFAIPAMVFGRYILSNPS